MKNQKSKIKNQNYNVKFKSFFRFFFITGFFLTSYFILHTSVAAQAPYPISELGNCRDAKKCYLYCQIAQNTPACWSYGTYILSQHVLGQQITSDEEIAKKHGITFPITELGNCANITACKAYCEIPANHEACTNFAKTHGLAKETKINKTLEDAKIELGCTTIESCKAYCEQNHERCMEFAKRHSMSSQKTKRQGPGGCDSEDSCRKYCQEHAGDCKGFKATTGDTNYSGSYKKGDYLGPGGCKTESECKNYCQSHPSECPGFQKTYVKPTEYQTYPTYYPKPTYSYEQLKLYPTYQPSQEQYQQPTYYPQPTNYQQQSYPTYSPEQYQQPTLNPIP